MAEQKTTFTESYFGPALRAESLDAFNTAKQAVAELAHLTIDGGATLYSQMREINWRQANRRLKRWINDEKIKPEDKPLDAQGAFRSLSVAQELANITTQLNAVSRELLECARLIEDAYKRGARQSATVENRERRH